MPTPNCYIYNTTPTARAQRKSQKRKQEVAFSEIAFPRHEGEATDAHEISIFPKQDLNNDNPVGTPNMPHPLMKSH